MAIRARLSAPKELQEDWPFHHAKWGSISSSMMWGGDRRMEAENYLSGGYGIRQAMEARHAGRGKLSDIARIWQPSRLKGIQVSRDYGTPFLAATQVFDLRPAPRKFLSLDRTDSVAERQVAPGQILVTCSGSVGRATMSHRAHEGMLISHDLLRVNSIEDKHGGWVYAFLRSQQGRAMMTAAQYGHIIKHLEIAHLGNLPIPTPREDLLDKFAKQAQKILDLRIEAFEKAQEAEQRFAGLFPNFKPEPVSPTGFSIKASQIFGSRQRLEASSFSPLVSDIEKAFHKHAKRVEPLSKVAEKVFAPGRFKHIYGDGGMPYLDSADILEVNPDVTKFVLSLSQEEQKEYHVEPGWLLLPCSGQVYGNLGHAVLATEYHVGKVLTNHILRIAPNERIRGGYLQCVLGHPDLGRPRVVRFAFGSSVPEIAAVDVLTTAIPRFDAKVENLLADLMEESAVARDTADALEQTIGEDAEKLIDLFLEGNTDAFEQRAGDFGNRPPTLISASPKTQDVEHELSYDDVDHVNLAFAPLGPVVVKSSL